MENDIELNDPEVLNDDLIIRNKSGFSSWKDKPLKAWNAIRQTTAQRMGMRWGRIPIEELQDAANNGQYDGVVTDVILLVWLRLQNDEDIAGYYLTPKVAFVKAMAWADSVGVSYPSIEFFELQKIFLDTVTDVNKAIGEFKTDTKPSENKERKNSSRRRG